MDSPLSWEYLFSDKRERDGSPLPADGPIVRNAFEADYDRIVGSSSVRRLQDKAQVYPLQQNDVVRTRLTHSLEVSGMARSLGKATGYALKRIDDRFTDEYIEKLACLLQTAGLIHDLGNPPFGHYGETIIRRWFADWFSSDFVLAAHNFDLTEQQLNDFRYFDGNVQNLRIVSKLQTLNDTNGANFTYATLGTIMKYPWNSIARPEKDGYQYEKFGYFLAEEDLAKRVRDVLGLEDSVRHPATYLLEAADDIIYLCDDIEDGAKKGLIDWDVEYDQLKAALDSEIKQSPSLQNLFERIDEKKPDKNMHLQEQKTARVRNFRNLTQSFLFAQAVEAFITNYDMIMSNKPMPGFELLSCQEPLVSALNNITKEKCFSSREALSLELVGDKVVTTLLDIFVHALIKHNGKTLSDIRTYPGKLFQLISPNFVYIAFATCNQCKDVSRLQEKIDRLPPYNRLLLVTDFISGMTDSYAVNIYQELMGMKHPTL